MRRRYKANASATAPLATQATSEGFPTEGDITAGVDATVPGPFVFYQLVEAIVTVIEEAGETPDDDPNQFRDALVSLINTAGVGFATNQQTIDGVLTTVATNPAGVRAALDHLIGTAGPALDTLGELSDALDDDANFATTVTNQIAATRNMVLYDQDIAVPITGHTEVQLTDSAADFRWLELVYTCPGRGGPVATARIRVGDLGAAPAISTTLSGVLYASDTLNPDRLYSLDRYTGVVQFERLLPGIPGPYSMAYLPGALYIIDTGEGGASGTLYSLDIATLAITEIGDTGLTDLFALGAISGTLYALVSNAAAAGIRDRLFSIAEATGVRTEIGQVAADFRVGTWSAMAPAGGTLYAVQRYRPQGVSNDISRLVSVNTATGAVVEVGRVSFIKMNQVRIDDVLIAALAGIGDTLYAIPGNTSQGEVRRRLLTIDPTTTVVEGGITYVTVEIVDQISDDGTPLGSSQQLVGMTAAETSTSSLSSGLCLIGDDDPALAAWSDPGDDTQLRLVSAPAAMTVHQVVGVK